MVLFFPTTAYELYCLEKMNSGSFDFEFAGGAILENKIPLGSDYCDSTYIPDRQQIHSVLFVPAAKNAFVGHFRRQNLYGLQPDNHYFDIIQMLTTDLFSQYPLLKKAQDEVELFNQIRSIVDSWSCKLLRSIVATEDSGLKRTTKLSTIIPLMELDSKSKNPLITRIIALEYKAREKNKAFLLRGTTYTKQQASDQSIDFIFGTSILISNSVGSLKRSYRDKAIEPYSISFGNSLFAGILNDPDACAYFYLMGHSEKNSFEDADGFVSFPVVSRNKNSGYALFVDKAEYVRSRCNRLFFITPLSTAFALSQKGEIFHSRATAAVFDKTKKFYQVRGIRMYMHDPAGHILITRDPLFHAELFSNYLIENMEIIQHGDNNLLTDVEKESIENMQKSQKKASLLYKGIRPVKRFFDRIVHKVKK